MNNRINWNDVHAIIFADICIRIDIKSDVGFKRSTSDITRRKLDTTIFVEEHKNISEHWRNI